MQRRTLQAVAGTAATIGIARAIGQLRLTGPFASLIQVCLRKLDDRAGVKQMLQGKGYPCAMPDNDPADLVKRLCGIGEFDRERTFGRNDSGLLKTLGQRAPAKG